MNMVLGRCGALHKMDDVCAAAETDDRKNILLKVKDKSLGAEIPYVFVTSSVFDLCSNDQPILPVEFREDERLRQALGLYYPRELRATEREKTRLLDNDCAVEFLFGELRCKQSGADDIDLRTVPTIRAQGGDDEFWLESPTQADYVMVRVEGDIRRTGDVIGFQLVRDKRIVGAEVVTYFVLLTRAFANWSKDVPVAGECYAYMEQQYSKVMEELNGAVMAHEEMIEAELAAKKH